MNRQFPFTMVIGFLLAAWPLFTLASPDWNPETAVSDAQAEFEKNGYSPITITDGQERFHGEKEIDQEVIFCAMRDADARLLIYKIDSIHEEGTRSYVTRYNTEMMRLMAEREGCFNR